MGRPETKTGFDWDANARAAGFDRDRRFNAATMQIRQARALVWCRRDGSTLALSGDAIHRRAAQLAAALAKLGIGPGDRLAGVLGRRPECFILPLATWRLGAIYVPLFSGFGSEALRVRLIDSGAKILLADAQNSAPANDARSKIPDLVVAGIDADVSTEDVDLVIDSLDAAATDSPEPHDTRAEDPATIMYTSGTTGTPKGCVIPHYGIITLWPFVDHCLAMGKGSTLFSTADAGWSFGLYTTGFAPMTRGITRVLYEGDFDPAQWWRVARETGAAHFASAPTGYRQLAAAGPDALGPEAGRELSTATSCGEPLTAEVVAWFEENLGFTIHDSYGATELGILIAQLRGEGAVPPQPGSMGQDLPGFELRLVGEDGGEVPEGSVGRVAVRDHGWLLSTDYWNRSEEWEARIHDGWWVSEDLARREGEHYWYVGRADDVIVTAGYNVGPTEVENVLLKHPAIVDAACIGEPDERKGQIVAAHVVLRDAGSDPDLDLLLDELRTRVGTSVGWHAAPRRLHISSALPRTESGKVRRAALRSGG